MNSASHGVAVFAAAAIGVHGVLEIDENFEAVLLQAVDGLPRHEQILFGRCFERAFHVEQPRLDDDDRGGNPVLVAEDELHIGPILDLGTAAARAPEESQPHGAGVDGFERAGEVGDELVGAGESNLRVTHAEGGHPLQKQHGVGHRDLEVRLLHAVAQAGVKKLDLWGRGHGG